jgi:hypothetical protein
VEVRDRGTEGDHDDDEPVGKPADLPPEDRDHARRDAGVEGGQQDEREHHPQRETEIATDSPSPHRLPILARQLGTPSLESRP